MRMACGRLVRCSDSLVRRAQTRPSTSCCRWPRLPRRTLHRMSLRSRRARARPSGPSQPCKPRRRPAPAPLIAGYGARRRPGARAASALTAAACSRRPASSEALRHRPADAPAGRHDDAVYRTAWRSPAIPTSGCRWRDLIGACDAARAGLRTAREQDADGLLPAPAALHAAWCRRPPASRSRHRAIRSASEAAAAEISRGNPGHVVGLLYRMMRQLYGDELPLTGAEFAAPDAGGRRRCRTSSSSARPCASTAAR